MTSWRRACEAVLHWDEENSIQGFRSDLSTGFVVDRPLESIGRARRLAQRFNVSHTYISKARTLFLTDPEHFEEVKNGAPFKTITPVVYAIGTGVAPTKIGHTGDLDSRLRSIQTGHPYKLKIIATLNSGQWLGADALEYKIHTLLAPRRLEGEWFDIDVEGIVELFNSLEEETNG